MSESKDLKPCPFCGNRETMMYSEPVAEAVNHNAVFCAACESSGPSAPTTDLAIAAWNKRHTGQSVGDFEPSMVGLLRHMAAEELDNYGHNQNVDDLVAIAAAIAKLFEEANDED